MNNEQTAERFEIWAKVELMGHQWVAGRCTEESRFGTVLLRVDIPGPDGATQFTRYFGGSAIYSINPVTPEIAIALAARAVAEPVQPYQLAQLAAAAAAAADDDEDELDRHE